MSDVPYLSVSRISRLRADGDEVYDGYSLDTILATHHSGRKDVPSKPSEAPEMTTCAYCGGPLEKWGADARHVDHYDTTTGKLLRVDVYHIECHNLDGQPQR